METDPGAAAKALGMQLPDGVKLKIQIQRRDTLYFVIPPLAKRPEDASADINQMDLWQSADIFCWIVPQALKLELLAMRQAYRKAHP